MHKTLLLAATSAALLSAPAVVQAQAAPGILVVDTETVMQTCTACRAAQAQLQTQANALESRQQSLASQFKPEEDSIRAQVKALGSKEPTAALKTKIQSLQTREQQAQDSLQSSADTFKSTAAHVQQQIQEKLIQVVEQVRAQRRAAIVFSKNAALANDNSLDVTSEVLAALNQQLPAVSITPMPQTAPTSGQPQGR